METDEGKEVLGGMSPFQEWLFDSLKRLCHPDPLSVIQCIGTAAGTTIASNSLITSNSSSSRQHDLADSKFRQLVIWLEDYIIRQWEETKRKKFLYYQNISGDSSVTISGNNCRNNNCDENRACPNDRDNFFWETGLPQYLSDLDCPKIYYCSNYQCNIDQNGNSRNGLSDHHTLRCNSIARKRVLHWIICCAISDAYGDILSKDNDDNPSSGTISIMDALPSLDINEMENAANKYDLDIKNFPLGFTTNNKIVDEIATVMRMKHVHKMRQFQNNIIKKVEDLQLQSIKSKEE